MAGKEDEADRTRDAVWRRLNVLLDQVAAQVEADDADPDAWAEARKKADALYALSRAARSIDALAPRGDAPKAAAPAAVPDPQEKDPMDDDPDELERLEAQLSARIDSIRLKLETKRAAQDGGDARSAGPGDGVRRLADDG